MNELPTRFLILTVLLFPALFLSFSITDFAASDTPERQAFRQNGVDTLGCNEPLFGENVLLISDSLRQHHLIRGALIRGDIPLPDTMLIISTPPITELLGCVGRIPTDLASLEQLFGEDLFVDGVEDEMIVSLMRYQYFNNSPFTLIPLWNDFNCEPPFCYAPIEVHALQITLEDNCGNLSSGLVFFEVKDLTPPFARCLDSVAVQLTPVFDSQTDPIGKLAVEELNAGSWDNCIMGDIKARRKLSTPEDRDKWIRATGNTLDSAAEYSPWVDTLFFFCEIDDREEVELLVSDASGNTDTCFTQVQLLFEDACYISDPFFGFMGTINTEEGIPVPEVRLQVSGSQNRFMMTGPSGAFDFYLSPGGDYRLTASKTDEPPNGVSTFDLILIQKHILGQSLLDSPYKMIAADVNQSGSISVLDLIQLQKLILNLETNLTEEQSWRFVPADYPFPDPGNPWEEAFPESIYVEDVNRSLDASFIGIKVGDVNNSVLLNN